MPKTAILLHDKQPGERPSEQYFSVFSEEAVIEGRAVFRPGNDGGSHADIYINSDPNKALPADVDYQGWQYGNYNLVTQCIVEALGLAT